MRRELKSLDDFRESTNESLGAVYRSFNQLNQSLTEFSRNAFNRAIETQAELAKKAYESYISEASKLGQMFLTGSRRFVVQAEERRALDVTSDAASSNKSGPQRTAAQRVTNQRKSGAAKRPSGAKRSTKAKR
jgi:hypothetical protein